MQEIHFCSEYGEDGEEKERREKKLEARCETFFAAAASFRCLGPGPREGGAKEILFTGTRRAPSSGFLAGKVRWSPGGEAWKNYAVGNNRVALIGPEECYRPISRRRASRWPLQTAQSRVHRSVRDVDDGVVFCANLSGEEVIVGRHEFIWLQWLRLCPTSRLS